MGPEKRVFVEGLLPYEVSQDLLRGERFLSYPGTLWVYQFPSKPSQGKVLQGFPAKPENPGGGPKPRVGAAYCPLKEPFPIWPPAALIFLWRKTSQC